MMNNKQEDQHVDVLDLRLWSSSFSSTNFLHTIILFILEAPAP